MQPKLSTRSNVEPFHAMDVLAEANRLKAAGNNVLSLAVGQPGNPAPLIVRDAAAQAALHAPIGYTDALGRADTRFAIAKHYADHYGVEVSPDRIAITTGSSAGFMLAFLAITEPGGRIAIAAPGYPAYRNIIKSLSLEAVEIPSGDSTDNVFDLDAFLAAHKTKKIDALMIASPANPTGTTVSKAELTQIIEVCDREGITFISDEIYHRLNYVVDDLTALSVSNDAIVINSFSKYYCMTGWRIGWMVLPQNMVRTVERLAQSLYICAPEISQIAAPKAFEASKELEEIKEVYRANRQLLVEELPKMGITFAAPPDGAFYAWCDVSTHTNDSMDFAKTMLREIYVAGAPGVDFDPVNGNRYMRFSYAGNHDAIVEAVERMKNWIGG